MGPKGAGEDGRSEAQPWMTRPRRTGRIINATMCIPRRGHALLRVRAYLIRSFAGLLIPVVDFS